MGRIKITWDQAQEIRARKLAGATSKTLAGEYGVSKEMINYIIAGKSHVVPNAISLAKTTHGQTNTPLYRTWIEMRRRCYSINHKDYKFWGGRGITVCDRWQKFEAFAEDVGPRPGPGLTIDRIDNNGNYEPGNVRWATQLQQQNNRRPKSHVRGIPVKRKGTM